MFEWFNEKVIIFDCYRFQNYWRQITLYKIFVEQDEVTVHIVYANFG